MNKYYLHSAIPYVNAAPHIGHAQEFVYADVIKRFQKLQGNDVLYLCGADENALKIVQAAEKAGLDTQAFCDQHSQEFVDLGKNLHVEFDIWQRATDRQHHFPASQKLWELCNKNGDIYKKSYTGLYCIGCEAFYTPDELNEKGECFEHPGKQLEKVTEENYFFKLSKYQDFLEDFISQDKLKVTPQIRKNEALSFIRHGLQDFSISRSTERARNWGVPVPNDPSQIMYVWFDALNIYQSGIGFGWDEEKYTTWWPPQVMVIGKGILRFHAIYWMAILKSAGIELPKELFVHGYLTVDGTKMSKTLGNVIDPNEYIEKYGADAVRYYLLREIPSYGDGDFSDNRFKEVYNADLANGLGNLVARVAKLAQNSDLEFTVPNNDEIYTKEEINAINEYQFSLVLNNIWKVHLSMVDQHINQNTPWIVKDKNKLYEILQEEIDMLITLVQKLQPFLPNTAERVLDQFATKKIVSQPPLFPRIA